MSEEVKMRYPTYLEEFKCIGGSCEDNCCCGWAIHIDRITFEEYKHIQDKKIKKYINKNIFIKKKCNNEKIDYAQIILKRNKRCPFLNKDNYCIIHSNLGEEYLSNVCAIFPKVLNKIDEYYEMSLDVSCIEAARILLSKEEGIDFTEGKRILGKHVLTLGIDTNDRINENTAYKYIKLIRDMSIEIVKNRKYKLNERLHFLGVFLQDTCKVVDYDIEELPRFISSYKLNSLSRFKPEKERYILQLSFYKIMLEKLKVFEKENNTHKKLNIKEVISGKSSYFQSSIKKVIYGFKLNEDKSIMENSTIFIRAYDLCEHSIFEKYSYIFENYLANHMYKELFPFSENDKIMDGYIMLLVRFSYIRFYLVGQYLAGVDMSKENIIKSIQVLSKEIEHDATYLEDVLRYIKENDLNNDRFANILL